MDDRECIARCLNGSPDSFRDLVERYQSPLLSYLAGILGNWDGAEEAAQETVHLLLQLLQGSEGSVLDKAHRQCLLSGPRHGRSTHEQRACQALGRHGSRGQEGLIRPSACAESGRSDPADRKPATPPAPSIRWTLGTADPSFRGWLTITRLCSASRIRFNRSR